jgi:NAD(P)-dependent dehydrogenase (short-subunit alcohol dehydrogenase family)
MDLGLRDQVALIVGGSSGIGRTAADVFLQEQAKVVVWDQTPPRANADVDSKVAQDAPPFAYHPVDITDRNSLEIAFRKTLDEFGHIDHVVHTAAIGSGKFGFPYTNLSPDDWPRLFQVNVMGMVHIAHLVGPHLRDRKSGTMTFIASVAGQIGSQTDPPYSASKAANINFAQCLAKDLAPHQVRVNIVNPGMVKTPLNRSVWQAWYDQQPESERLSYDQWSEEKIRKVVPLGRWQTTEDIANAIVFLASKRASCITGQCLNVDGGFVMHW